MSLATATAPLQLPPLAAMKVELGKRDPSWWVGNRLGEHVWSKQREILESVRDNRRTAVHSCHATGKSFIAARVAAWWIETHPLGEAFVVTSAPTGPQVRAILWREIGRAHVKGKLTGRTNQTEWHLTPPDLKEELVAYGRKPSEFAPDAFQGIHAPYVLVIFDESCHDDLTDVMTNRGWVRFSELDRSDKLLTMDPQTHEAEYVDPIRIVAKSYSGPMVRYKAKGSDYCVTPDHKMYTHQSRGKARRPWRFIPADDLKKRHNQYMRRDVRWQGAESATHTIPALVSARKRFDSSTVEMDDWLTFLAWYSSEGHLTVKSDKAYVVGITQKDPVALDEIEALCHRLGLNPKRYDDCGQVRIHRLQLGEYLSRQGIGCTVKRLPRYVSECSVRQINLFLDTYVRGDGYQQGSTEIIYTSSPLMADDLQELILKTGKSSVVRKRHLPDSDFGTHIAHPSGPGYVVTRPAKPAQLKSYPKNFSEVDYSGTVYCATLPKHHLLLTRRNGYALWSGNCGMPLSLWEAADSLISNEGSKILAIGNPDDPNTEFAEVCAPGSGWNVVAISAFDTPNFTEEVVPAEVKQQLISRTWQREKLRKWGETNPLYISKVLGEFPETTEDGLIPMTWIKAAQERELEPGEPVELGVDVGGGGDKSIVAHRQGSVVRILSRDQNPDTMQTCGKVIAALKDTGAVVAKVDEIGIGRGVVDRGKEQDQAIEGINVGSAAPCSCPRSRKAPGHASDCPRTSFSNLRAYGYWKLRERFQDGDMDIDAADDDLAAQLVDLRFKRTSSGKIQMESKDEIKRRGKPSPDEADAIMLAFIEPQTETKVSPVWGRARR